MTALRHKLEELVASPIGDVESAETVAEAARLLRDLVRLERDVLALVSKASSTSSEVGENAPAYGSGGFEGLTLHEAAKRVLAAAGCPLHVRDLGARIKGGGWRHPRASHARPDQIEYQLAARLPRHPSVFRKVGPNTFGLTEWPDTRLPDRRAPRLGTVRGRGPKLARRIGDEPDVVFEERRKPWRSS